MLVGLLIYVVIEDTFAISYDIAQKSQLISLKGERFGWTCMLGAVGTSYGGVGGGPASSSGI